MDKFGSCLHVLNLEAAKIGKGSSGGRKAGTGSSRNVSPFVNRSALNKTMLLSSYDSNK
jgi:hypothetical protein